MNQDGPHETFGPHRISSPMVLKARNGKSADSQAGDGKFLANFSLDQVGAGTPPADIIAPHARELATWFNDETIPRPSILDEQWRALETVLKCPISAKARELVREAIQQLVACWALDGVLSKWSDHRISLMHTISSADAFLNGIHPTMRAETSHDGERLPRHTRELLSYSAKKDRRVSHDLLSANTSVSIYLWSNIPDMPEMFAAAVNAIRPILAKLHQALEEGDRQNSKAGPKGDQALDLFLSQVWSAATLCRAHPTLPSRAIKDIGSGAKSTKFFEFARALLEIVVEAGEAAIEATTPTDKRKAAAKRKWHHRMGKTYGALVDHCYTARQMHDRTA